MIVTMIIMMSVATVIQVPPQATMVVLPVMVAIPAMVMVVHPVMVALLVRVALPAMVLLPDMALPQDMAALPHTVYREPNQKKQKSCV